nr:MAG TPA: hypothetical protein [Caudoviricetes sp.]
MITKTLTYEDYDGNPITEEAYFHLTEADATEMFTTFGDVGAAFDRGLAEKNPTFIMNALRNLIRMSYGKKLPDGRFVKFDSEGRRLGDFFISSDAYSELVNSLITDENAILEFIKGIMPVKFKRQIAAELAAHPENVPSELAPMAL